jgi:large subunit ribosomal protein L25
MEICDLNACARSESGKGAARRLRQRGGIPAVFYGPKSEAVMLSVKSSDIAKIMKENDENVFIKLIIDDHGKNIERLSMIRELQRDAVKGSFLHADFYEVSMDQKLVFEVPIHFVGAARGVENGGELLHVKRELKISCLPQVLPEFVEVDISTLDIGHSLKVGDIPVGKGIAVLDHEDVAVVSVMAQKVVHEVVEEAEVSEEKQKEETKEAELNKDE